MTPGPFVDGWLLSLSLCLDLGIVNLAIVRAGILRGLAPAFLVGLGSCVGDIAWAGLAGAGVAALLQFAVVRYVLWIGGTVALAYLTVQMTRQAFSPPRLVPGVDAHGAVARPHAQLRDLVDGVLLALASPSAILWFAAVGGSLIAATIVDADTFELTLFYVGFFLQGVAWSFGIAFLASVTGRTLGPALVRGAAIASSALFAWFAVRVFIAGLQLLDSPP